MEILKEIWGVKPWVRKESQLLVANNVRIWGKKQECTYVLSKSESVEFALIESVICLFTDSSVQKYLSLTNQLIFTDWINGKNIFHC